MSTQDRKLWLTYNGEVYNYVELRSELEKRGRHFFSTSDSEVILEAYRVWGLQAFERFNGMWALAIWDVEQRKLVLSRDRMGVKPLYFHRNDRRLIFASEVKALLAAEPELARLDRATMAEFVEYPIVSSGKYTFFEGVERFEPGSFMVVEPNGREQRKKYWTFLPPKEPIQVRDEEAAERVQELLADSVRLRFRSDVPVGTCLSGGLDSSSIVALAKLKLGKAPESFSAIYDVAGFEERAFVDVMAKEMDLIAHRIEPDASDLAEVMERSAYYQEEPTAGPGIYSQWHVMRVASTRVKVLLDGQGSDEIFGGYFPFFDTYARSLLDRSLRLDTEAMSELATMGPKVEAVTGKNPVRTLFQSSLIKRRVGIELRKARNLAIRQTRAAVEHSPVLHDLGRVVRRTLVGEEAHAGTPPAMSLGSHEARPGFAERRQTPVITGDRFTDLLWDQTIRTSIPGLLHYEDRNSMAFSIEARVPFLDYRLVEYAFQLPSRLKMGGGETKAVLRAAMKGILPEPIRQRKDKKGYPTPFSVWLRDSRHHEWARELLPFGHGKSRGFWNPARAELMWKDHVSEKADHSWSLWQMITGELFFRQYIDGPFVPRRP